jgi:hypothetical protein
MYLIELIKKISMEQAGMFLALIKFRVKALGNFSENINEFPISWPCSSTRVKEPLVGKGGMRKKLKISICYWMK